MLIDRVEVVFSDLGAQCTPRAYLSDKRELYKWCAVPFATARYRGSMLNSMTRGRPQPVILEPELTGWYRIFIGMGPWNASVNLKLRSDGACTNFGWQNPYGGRYVEHNAVEEVYWKAADMTGESVVISKYRRGDPKNATLAWLRFAPMSEDEVTAHKADVARTDTKRLYATNDMHGVLIFTDPVDAADWRSLVQCHEQSDVEWLSMENAMIYNGDTSTGDDDNFAYPRDYDATFQRAKKNMTP